MFRSLVVLTVLVLLVLSASVAPATAQEKPAKELPQPSLLIIAANDLASVGEEWTKHREGQGRKVRLVTLANLAVWSEKDKPSLVDIKRYIKEAAGEKPAEDFQVLLLGDCPAEGSEGYDPKTEIPWFMSTYKDAYERSSIPGDNFLADVIGEDNEIPDFAIGRIPARTKEQGMLALAKVKAYESAKMGDWCKRLTFFAGEGRFGAAVDQMLENLFTQMAEQVIDPAYDLRMTYANVKSPYAYIPAKFNDKVFEEANSGSLLLSYMGHGACDRLDDMRVPASDGKKEVRFPIMHGKDCGKFKIDDGKLPVMIIVACATGYLDHKEQSLSECICFTEKAPVAVISSSRDSHPYSNTLLQNALISEITKNKRATLGEAFVRAKREIVLGEDGNRKKLEQMAAFIIPKKEEREKLNRAHLHLYNLIGDPALKLRHPNIKPSFSEKSANCVQGGEVELTIAFDPGIPARPAAGTAEGDSAELHATLELRRSQIQGEIRKFEAKDLAGSDVEKRKAAEEAVAENHAQANNKVIAKARWTAIDYGPAACTGGKFIIKVDESLAPGDYIVKLLALDSKGRHCGFASLKLKVKAKE